MTSPSPTLTIAAAQISPIWGDRAATLDKVISFCTDAAQRGADLVAFGEAVLPGYPFWLELTGGARFNNVDQKTMHAHYMQQAVVIERGDLAPLQAQCKQSNIACYIGLIERASNRGGHSLYCSFVYIDKGGVIGSVHRKLMPTYEERLAWSVGDGNGLVTHALGGFTVGGLNCWENWMPLARASLYAQGENLHVACWPGGLHNTDDITRFMAKEGRSYVLSVSGVMHPSDFPKDTPVYDQGMANAPDTLASGGSCIAAPDGSWLVAPLDDSEQVVLAEIDLAKVYEERQNLDVSGHYSRPDVFSLEVDRRRQQIASFKD